MKLQYATFRTNDEERELLERACDVVSEDLPLDFAKDELFRCYLADDVRSSRNDEPLAGQVSGDLERGFTVRLRAGRAPRDLFLTVCHELRHIFQQLASLQTSKPLSENDAEADAARYARIWDHRLPRKCVTYRQIINYLKKLDNEHWSASCRKARIKLAQQQPDRAKLIEHATMRYRPARAHAGREYTANRRQNIEYR